jgi:CTP:molybdopterin cytidylyltransferase MocA
MAQNETVWTIVVAAGSGLRFGAAKQFEVIGGRRIVDWAVEEGWPALRRGSRCTASRPSHGSRTSRRRVYPF